jgi:hypothetical protein
MPFKYQADLPPTNCPPANYQPTNREAYRFVHEDVNHPNNFLPVFKIKPARKLSTTDDSQVCKGYGLSMFDTLENASNRYNSLTADNPNIWRSIGTHIAKGQLTERCGVCGSVDSRGHFTFHEYEGIDLVNKFAIVLRVK